MNEENKEKVIEILKQELKQNVLDFLNHEYVIEKIREQEDNQEFIMGLYDILNEINVIVKQTIKTKYAPSEEILTEEEAFRRVIEYNRQAKEAKKNSDRKKAKKFYDKKSMLLKKYGKPLCIHSLGGGYRVVLVKLKNGTFHCPVNHYSLDELENLKTEDFNGIIE